MPAELDSGLWVHPVSIRKAGADAQRQLPAVRLVAGGIHSPAPVTPVLRAALAALGEVRHVIGPNRWHDEGLAPCQSAYSEAEFHAAPCCGRRLRS